MITVGRLLPSSFHIICPICYVDSFSHILHNLLSDSFFLHKTSLSLGSVSNVPLDSDDNDPMSLLLGFYSL
ncbi:hypothetical protein V6Z12_A11G138400 [Gossypium hirsutum]